MKRNPVFNTNRLPALMALALLVSACVDTNQTGKRSIATSATGGTASGGDTAIANDGTLAPSNTTSACGDTVDSATDGALSTPSSGPYNWKNVAIRGGGFVDGIIFSPVEKGLVYARTDMGGAYRWDQTLYGWVPLTDWIGRAENNQIGIESIAADPLDPNIVYLAAGTYLTAGNGVILRSTDRGNTFTALPIGVPMGGNTDGRSMGERLSIDPNLTSTLYFASRGNGLMRSRNSGTTWDTVATFPVVGGVTSSNTQLGLSFVEFDPTSGTPGNGSSTFYVGVADLKAGSNLYVTHDGGTQFDLVPGGPTNLMPHHVARTTNGKLYLAYNDGPGPNSITKGSIWTYDPASGAFTQVTSLPSGAYGFGGISADATLPGTVVVATLDWWNPDEIYRTTDDGAHFTPIGRSAKHNPNGAEWLRWGKSCASPNASGWMGDIEIDPFDSSHVLYVTGQGVWSSLNAQAAAPSNIEWRFEDRNLEQTAVIDMQSSVNGAFLSCVGDIAGSRSDKLDSPAATGMYANPIFGNCASIDFAGQDPNFVVRAGTPNSANAGKLGGYSKDNGNSWAAFAKSPEGTVTSGAGGKIAISADGGTIVWTPPNTNPAYSTDFGATWNKVDGLPMGTGTVADRVNANKFYAYVSASTGGAVYVSLDAGKTFTAAPNTVSFTGRGRLRSVFGREGDLWLVANGQLYRSSESGANFALVASMQAAYAVGFGKSSTTDGYPSVFLFGQVGAVTGFFRSDDAGIQWTRINDDAHQFGTAGFVAGDENVYGRVYIGTNGRGIVYGEPKN